MDEEMPDGLKDCIGLDKEYLRPPRSWTWAIGDRKRPPRPDGQESSRIEVLITKRRREHQREAVYKPDPVYEYSAD